MSEVLWFRSPHGAKVHAFDIVDGMVDQRSVCSLVELETCDDEALLEPEERHGAECEVCKSRLAFDVGGRRGAA